MSTDHDDASSSDVDIRVRALESSLVAAGYVEAEALDRLVEAHETTIGPHIGARAVARAWSDPGYRRALLADAASAVAPFTHTGRVGDQLIVVENTEAVHNLVVCTLCSCYPWDVLGLPPVWYKSPAYRSRAVREPRAVLAELGVELGPETTVRVWDSTAEVRYLVLPMRPAGTDGWSEERLAQIVGRDAMIGTALPTVS
ncbi:nitrile hydratase subunit alpha [Mycolicibacterium sediminis]|uniref:nitrile hydratase n=1 Tax=Mycolicibacterium sediminis TaxID=1286180 RepID=A0A7I7QTH5_9MYCO|nr:nitrile hydratase subunit alpha [Mycolicibacterium sediminis]BBY29703.1 nitrile hydratase subunit alpha [Mycolicibacterium sediminis]